MTATESPFLTGLLTPVGDERDDFALEVTGNLPASLRGMFVRNGPNPMFAPTGRYHPFDGDGMVHALYIDDGTVAYRNRWVRSRGSLAERGGGRGAATAAWPSSGPPRPTWWRRPGSIKNTANTHFVRHAGRYLALLGGGPADRADTATSTPSASTTSPAGWSGRMTAHPKIDPQTGEMMFFGYSPMPAVPALPRRRSRRQSGAQRRDRPARAGDDARLRRHRELRRVHRPAGGVRPRSAHVGRGRHPLGTATGPR